MRCVAVAALVLALMAGPISAQVPTGTISGILTDASGARIANLHVGIANLRTGQSWSVAASTEGLYSFPALVPGEYRVTVTAARFSSAERDVSVEAGTTTTVDIRLEVRAVASRITVRAALSMMHREDHQIGAVVRREQIENVPLNGRNVLELAKLEPGVTSPVRGAAGNRTFIATLGSGLQAIPRVGFTRVTVDGASINAFGTIGTSLQISPDVVEEFQLSTAGFDSATGLTTNGAVNVVTRSGSNEYQGSASWLYRDHHLAAYPGLVRDPRNPNPFFRRQQFGGAVGGPIRAGRAFFMGSYERHDQTGVVTVQAPEFQTIGGIFETPLAGDLLTARVDARLTDRQRLMVRYTRDASSSFAQPLPGVLPSGWADQINEADQIVIGLSGVLAPTVVHEGRVSYFYLTSDPRAAPDSGRCRDCFGVGAPQITVFGAGLTFGRSPNVQSIIGTRYQVTDQVTWQRGAHRFRAGFDWEHSTITSAASDADRLQLVVWSPQRVRQANEVPGGEPIPLPPSFTTVDDILQLPLKNFDLTIGPGRALEKGYRPHRVLDLYRLYVADTWRLKSSLTIDAGLGWSYEPNALNHDLTKPALVAPLLKERGLDAPTARTSNFSPALGVAWAARPRTVVRGGIGHYFDPAGSTNSSNLANERFLLAPLGTGRLRRTGSNMRWNGVLLDSQPTPLTAAQFLTVLPGIRAELASGLNPENRDDALRNLDRTKEGTNLYDPSYVAPSALHVTIGLQREIGTEFVVSADVVWKRFRHTFINGIDYNRYNSALGAVIRPCGPTEREDVAAACSNGPIMFDTTSGRARYVGLLVRAEKRMQGRGQFLASYALGSYVGSNGTGTGTAEMSSGRATGFRNDDWLANYGPMPTDLRHIVNVSGHVEVPWRFAVAFNVSAHSRPPFTAWLEGVDLDGDGTRNDLLPGTTVNAFNRGLDRADLVRLVDLYNQQMAGQSLCCGQGRARPVTLPSAYTFFDHFFTQDLRITHTLALGGQRVRLAVFGEVFNLFNTANLLQFSGNLLNPTTFGQPAARFTQIFGSGGPRALQLGARVKF